MVLSDSDVDSKELGVPEKQHSEDVLVASSLTDEQLNEGGAAVESYSPLGQHFGWFSVICLNLSQMVSERLSRLSTRDQQLH